MPFQSVAEVLPSTGRLQLNLASRRGTKLPCQYAIFPLSSAKTVLLELLDLRSITFLKALKPSAFVRSQDCMSALSDLLFSLRLSHCPSRAPITGPCCVA